MTTVTLEYRPFGILWKRYITCNMPSAWNELNARQLLAIPLMKRGLLKDTRILRIFLGLRRAIASRVGCIQRHTILKELKWTDKMQPMGVFLLKRLGKYSAPNDALKNVSFGQFIFGDTFYQNYTTGTKEDLNKFIACYYCDKSGFNENKIDRKARHIKRYPLFIREAIGLNYLMVREWLANAYPYVFQRSDKGAKGTGSGWVRVFDLVVGDDIVHEDEYARKDVNTVLRYLNNKIKDHAKNGSKVR